LNTSKPHYFVGIDLGTSHTVVAFARIDDPEQAIQLFAIPQLIAPGEVDERPLLPSVRYHPADGELSQSSRFLNSADGAVIGEAARLLGAKSQGRLVTSAKSWLSHNDIDPNADILPWGGDDAVAKVSPVNASASYLHHLVTVWQQRFPAAPLAQQHLVITVPASFDESARALTLQAAQRAGLNQVRLLEEPQAVCYDWLRRHQGQVAEQLRDCHLLLICDVGGGTTDLTLIRIEHGAGEPKLTRIAVGEHLMLGGDNIDWALAHMAEQRLRSGEQKLSVAAMAQLLEQCRIAKERLLGEQAPEQVDVTLLGSGSKLIGGSRSVTLTRDEVLASALQGFLPQSDWAVLPDKKRSGVVALGLPYASDPAISKHIAAFLQNHRQAARHTAHNERGIPDCVLLNGGLFRSQRMAQQLVSVLGAWAGETPKLLDNPHPELAVAFGAVSFAQSRHAKRTVIGGGAARSYFLLIESAEQRRQGLCLLPKGSEEGQEVWLQQPMMLRVGQPVRFHLLSYNGDDEYKPGDLTVLDQERFLDLPPLALVLPAQAQHEIAVRLLTAYTEYGTLQLQCVSVAEPQQRWDVEFQLRRGAAPINADLPQQMPVAVQKIQAVFGSKSKQVDAQAVKNLRTELEKLFAQARQDWSLPLLRALWQILMDGAKYRKRSEAHERLWLNLTGFCLRPGIGDALDSWRVEQIWKLYGEGLQFVNDKQNWAEWWTLWRRVAAGLPEPAQYKLFDDIAKFINPASARQPAATKLLQTRSFEDMLRLAAVLERLPVADKLQLGEWLLKRLEKSGESPQCWWALGRIGARVLSPGLQQLVIPAQQAELWIVRALAADWKKHNQAGWAAVLLARSSNDRARDVDAGLRERVAEKLKQSKAPPAWLELLNNQQALTAQQEQMIYGEALPPGLSLPGHSLYE
jgi:DNA-K related protein/Hsp70 protein